MPGLGPGIELKEVFAALKKKIVGDGTDRLMSLSSLLGLVCAMIYLGQQFFGTPMACVTKYDKDYVASICYIQSFFHVPQDHHAIKIGPRDEYWRINYFQFLALVFFAQSIVLYAPSYFWKKAYKKADIKLGIIIAVAHEIRDDTNVDKAPEKRANRLKLMSMTIIKKIMTDRLISKKQNGTSIWAIFSDSLLFRYIAMKFANAILLVYFIFNVASYLSDDFWWSAQRLYDLSAGGLWKDSERFPRMAYCDFQMRDMANIKNVTAQCTLAMNFVSEKLFFVEWVWFSFTFTLVIWNLLHFSYDLVNRKSMMAEWLMRQGKSGCKANNIFNHLAEWDGWLAIYLVQSVAGKDIASDFAGQIFEDLRGLVLNGPQNETSFVNGGLANAPSSDSENILPEKNPVHIQIG